MPEEIHKHHNKPVEELPKRQGQAGMGMGRGRGPKIVEKPKDFKGTLKKMLKYIGSFKSLFIVLAIVVVIDTALGLVSPIIQKNIVNGLYDVASTKDLVSIATDPMYLVFNSLILLVIIVLITNIFLYFRTRLSFKLSQKIVHKMRGDLFKKFVKLPIGFLDTHSHGDLMSRMTNDVDSVSNAFSQALASIISGVMMILGTLGIMIYYSWFLTLITLFTTALSVLATTLMTKKMRKYFKAQSALLGELNGHTEESVTGYRTVVAYQKEQDMKDKFADISNRFTKTSITAQIWGGSMGPVMNFIGNLNYVLIAAIGAWLWIKAPIPALAVDLGVIALFLSSSKQFTRPINEIANLFGQLISATAGAERVFEIMDSSNEIDEGDSLITDENFGGHIEFKNVNFSYIEGVRVLKNFSLDIHKGQKIALVGATGSGKTTIVNLLMRFYDVDSGEILIDGINIKDISKDSLRKAIAIVLQDTVLFKDTIEANIKYGNDNATFEEMKEASILANSNFFVKKLPDRYNTILSEGGSNISQGQRQLLTIARAVLASPKILILDEATSSVDTRTEQNIQDAMANLMSNRTSLIIAHRLSTIQDADVIVVIDHGEIVEKGNHKELLEKQGKYYDLYMTQFSGKEI